MFHNLKLRRFLRTPPPDGGGWKPLLGRRFGVAGAMPESPIAREPEATSAGAVGGAETDQAMARLWGRR